MTAIVAFSAWIGLIALLGQARQPWQGLGLFLGSVTAIICWIALFTH